MTTLKNFIKEGKENKNIHLEHIEDEPFTNGVDGIKKAISFLNSLRDMLSGHSKSPINLSTKFDGSPSIFAGINPENGKFFVGTKSIFNTSSKINYTEDDIDTNHTSPGLNEKLKVALRYLKTLDIKGILQGDIMFTEGDIKKETIDGEKYIIFQPNTIVYAVPENTLLAQQIENAKIGVVWHTSYTGTKINDMKSSFNVNIGSLKHNKDVWFRDASYVDVSGNATLTSNELKLLNHIIDEIIKSFHGISIRTLNIISSSDNIKNQIKKWNNQKIKEGIKINNSNSFVRDLILHVEETVNQSISDAKRSDTKSKRQKEKTFILNFYKQNRNELVKIYDLHNLIIDAKTVIIRKLENINSLGTFLRTNDGYKVTNPEGFVASDHLGNVVKLVDRLVFSKENFNLVKSWKT